MERIGNFTTGLADNVHPKETKNLFEDYIDVRRELTEAIDLIEDIDGLSRSSLVGLDIPPNFLECNLTQIRRQKVDELNWITENEDEEEKYKPELSDLAKKVESHSLRAIRAKLVSIIRQVFLFLASLFQRLKQAFYILIIFLIARDGYR